MRWCEPWTVAAIARASEVLPVPGASSSKRWPRVSMHVRESRITSSLPSTARDTFETSLSKVSANHAACSVVIAMGSSPGRGSGRWDRGERRSRPRALAVGGAVDEDAHGVVAAVVAVEALQDDVDVRRDVVPVAGAREGRPAPARRPTLAPDVVVARRAPVLEVHPEAATARAAARP